jgi:membrane protease subunit HflK
MIHEAKIYQEEMVHKAAGKAAESVAGAEGRMAERVADAWGMAIRFELLEEAARSEPDGTRLRLYLETVERALADTRLVVRPDESAVEDFEVWFQTRETGTLPEFLSGEGEEEKGLK